MENMKIITVIIDLGLGLSYLAIWSRVARILLVGRFTAARPGLRCRPSS